MLMRIWSKKKSNKNRNFYSHIITVVWHFFSYKGKHTLTLLASNFVSRYLPKWGENIVCAYKVLHTNIYSSFIYNSKILKQPRYPAVSECINQLWYLHKIEYFWVIKIAIKPWNTWRNFKHTMLSESCEFKKADYKYMKFWKDAKM